MALSKVQGFQIESPVDINAINITGVATFASAVVTGDLTVQGTTTTLDTTVENVDLLEVGANSAGAAVTVTQAGSGDFIHVGTAGSAFTVDNSGAIGIGTINPRSKLDIQGSNSELRFYRDAGDRYGGIRYTGSDWTFRLPTNDFLSVKSAGDNEELLRVDSSGRTGIGTIPSNFGNNANSLELHSPNSTQTYLTLTNTTTGSNGAANGLNLAMIGTTAKFLNRESGDIEFQISGTERFRITSDGNIGIATNSTTAKVDIYAPVNSNALEVHSTSGNTLVANINIPSSGGGALQLRNASGSTTFEVDARDSQNAYYNTGGLVGIATNNPQLAKLHIGAATYALNVQNNGNNKSFILFSKNATPNDARAWIEANGELSGGYLAFAAADGERFRINNNGIGIGTDDASYGLHLREQTMLMTSGHGSNTSTDIVYMHRFATSAISAKIQFQNQARDGSAYTANEPGQIVFSTRPTDNEASGQSGVLQERLTIHSDGRLFVNAGNCNSTTVDAALRIRGNYSDSARSVIVLFETTTQGRGKILTGNADADPPTFAASSDRRMKTNIRPYTGGYEKIKAIPVKIFDLTVGTAKTDNVGWIADEVSPIFPDSVLGEPDAERVLGFCTDAQGNVTCTDVLESCACEGDTWTETHREPEYQSLAPLSWYPDLVSAVQTLIAKVESLESAVGIAST